MCVRPLSHQVCSNPCFYSARLWPCGVCYYSFLVAAGVRSICSLQICVFTNLSNLCHHLSLSPVFAFACLDVPAAEQPELFLKKLQQCCTVFDFMDTLSDLKMKEYKRSTLNELVDYVTVSRGYLTEQAYPEVVKMVRKNESAHSA